MYSWIASLGISAACYRLSHAWWGEVAMHVINGLCFDRHHCRKAFHNQQRRKGAR